jgi:microcystin-dependent protein
MEHPFVGEIAWVAFDFAPAGWLICNGQALRVSSVYEQLYAVIGTRYGGIPGWQFNIPNLLERTMVGASEQMPLGSAGGSQTMALSLSQMPNHSHGATFTPTGAVTVTAGLHGQNGVPNDKLSATPTAYYTLANTDDPSIGGSPRIYAPPGSGSGAPVALGGVATNVTSNIGGSVSVSVSGSSQPFSLMQPYLNLLPIIAYVGAFPSKI